MPKADGIEVLAHIRKVDVKLPVLLLTVWKDPKTVAKAAEYGVTGYFQKPFNIKQVTECNIVIGDVA